MTQSGQGFELLDEPISHYAEFLPWQQLPTGIVPKSFAVAQMRRQQHSE